MPTKAELQATINDLTRQLNNVKEGAKKEITRLLDRCKVEEKAAQHHCREKYDLENELERLRLELKEAKENNQILSNNLKTERTVNRFQAEKATQTSSQKNKKFASGAVRSSDADGVRFDLITPVGLRRLAETYKEGSLKYGDNNWKKGFPVSDVLNHVIRHIYLWLDGDTTEDHLAHAAWGLFTTMHFEERNPECIDVERNKDAKKNTPNP